MCFGRYGHVLIACRALSCPELKDQSACVREGIVLTSNYCARKYGVRSAMAGWMGNMLVSELSGGKEQLINVPSHFQLCTENSFQVSKTASKRRCNRFSRQPSN